LTRWANIISKLAYGFADDLLSEIFISIDESKVPIYIAPGMNPNMWHNSVVANNATKLKERNIKFIDSIEGSQICGDFGLGNLADPKKIVDRILSHQKRKDILNDKKILVTAGSTIEAIDPVRYLGNHSSGKMGYAIANTFNLYDAKTTLISGSTNIDAPYDIYKFIMNQLCMNQLCMKYMM